LPILSHRQRASSSKSLASRIAARRILARSPGTAALDADGAVLRGDVRLDEADRLLRRAAGRLANTFDRNIGEVTKIDAAAVYSYGPGTASLILFTFCQLNAAAGIIATRCQP